MACCQRAGTKHNVKSTEWQKKRAPNSSYYEFKQSIDLNIIKNKNRLGWGREGDPQNDQLGKRIFK